MQDTLYLGQMVFDILQNDFHHPLVNGLCNRDNIEEEITIGIYKGEIEPLSQDDVDFVCDMVDELIKTECKQ